ncbi:beta-N-acetylhexosaminidase [Kitasatospora atroaurantiaca]
MPAPSQLVRGSGAGYPLTGATVLRAEGGPEAATVAGQLAALLHTSTGLTLPVEQSGNGGVVLRLDSAADTGEEGYRLSSAADGVTITAASAAGLFHGVQTLRQLLPVSGTGTVPSLTITDRPRYAYRGGMLDVARHFFPVAAVEQYVDLLAQYKFNHLHLHLTDDQGWRIAIAGWPKLTSVGGSTQVGGGAGGFYTADDYRAITAYAAARHITVVPEVDLPGHTTAALASYPELGCPGDRPAQLFTGIDVGFSRVCPTSERTRAFVDQVIGRLAELTPGPYLDIGGDEAGAVDAASYARFMSQASATVRAHGKQPMSWDDGAAAGRQGPAVLEVWQPLAQLPPQLRTNLEEAARGGTKLVMSPADHAYLDQKYDESTRLGLHWAGYLSVEKAYSWDPDTYLAGLPGAAVTGVEAPVWTETLATPQDLQSMLLPRLPALAEVAWSPQAARSWEDFRPRLAAQAPRWDAQQLAYTKVPEIDWPR